MEGERERERGGAGLCVNLLLGAALSLLGHHLNPGDIGAAEDRNKHRGIPPLLITNRKHVVVVVVGLVVPASLSSPSPLYFDFSHLSSHRTLRG